MRKEQMSVTVNGAEIYLEFGDDLFEKVREELELDEDAPIEIEEHYGFPNTEEFSGNCDPAKLQEWLDVDEDEAAMIEAYMHAAHTDLDSAKKKADDTHVASAVRDYDRWLVTQFCELYDVKDPVRGYLDKEAIADDMTSDYLYHNGFIFVNT